MEFENRFLVTKELYIEWVKHPIRKSIILLKYFWIFVLAFMIFLACFSITLGETTILSISIVFALFSVYQVAFRTRIIANKQFGVYSNMQGRDQWERVTTFTDKITVTDGCTTMEYTYDQITELINQKDYLALGIGDAADISYLRLLKNGFVGGTDKEFVEFLKSRQPDILLRSK